MTRFTTGGDALAESLIAQGVDTIFGIPGVQLDAACDALYYRKSRIHYICARNEQAVTYMADGYARSSGREGVGMVVPGPGVLNALAGLATAYSTNSRVLLICGQVDKCQIGKGDGVLHELPDQTGIIARLCKWHALAENAEDIPALVAEAFRQLRSGRPRPVVLEIPPDVLAAPIPADLAIPSYVEPEPVQPDADVLRQAAERIAKAERPLIYAGGGVRAAGASEELTALAHLLGAPVVVTENGRGDIDSDDPLAFDQVVFRKLRETADLIIAVGSRFVGSFGGELNVNDVPYICINADEADLTGPRHPEIAVYADAKPALAGLVALLGPDGFAYQPGDRTAEIAAAREWSDKTLAQLDPQREYLDVIGRVLGKDGVFVSEYTQIGYAAAICMPRHSPETYIGPGYEGTLGFGFATSLGVQAAAPDRRVVSVNGDGGFSWTMQELSTMRRFGLAVATVVFNDGYYGNVRRIQNGNYGGRVFSSDLTDPDYMKLAEAFGIAHARVFDPEELGRELEKALASRTPTLIEVPVANFPSPWNLVHEGIPTPPALPPRADRVPRE
ncbi:thiamine pyrophosphate-dependent enzyme [Bifidobacterium callitrichidarum]|uniref:Acetolactate synthase large subunit n=1 Tax=Bifidobacterium callitrichidarum TaxID=2052941 RepID=A0A2U2NAL6_9BIFI|nr:thiamine pyrophosphate-dependent enzyme [Bifidobacterium callitrichidarum]PWG66137.1 acetolactate synthase large subunit [Bifidobacterium callitrichidarum]